MMPIDNACGLKIRLDNYYTLGREGAETPEIITDVVMKNGYVNKSSLISDL